MDPRYSGEATDTITNVAKKAAKKKKYNPAMIFKIGKVVEAIYRREQDTGTSEVEIEYIIASTLDMLDVEYDMVEIQHNLVIS